MKEIAYNEINKIAGGIDLIDKSKYGTCKIEIREVGGRTMMYIYDEDGNFLMAKYVDIKPDPVIYTDYNIPEPKMGPSLFNN